MNKSRDLLLKVAVAFIVVGIFISFVAWIVAGFDRSNMHKFRDLEEMRFDASLVDINEINFDTANSAFRIESIAGNEIIIEYYQHRYLSYEILVVDGVLTMRNTHTGRRPWTHYVMNSGFFNDERVTVFLPASFNGDLNIQTRTGSIRSSDTFNLRNVVITATTGSIFLSNITAESLQIVASTGSINLTNIDLNGSLRTTNTTGSVRLNNVDAYNIEVTANTGSVTFDRVKSETSVKIDTTTGTIRLIRVTTDYLVARANTGSIRMTDLQSPIITLDTRTGSINGNIIGRQNDYSILINSSRGSSNLNNQVRPDTREELRVTTTTGSIRVSFSN
ncbi:MAG: DUF4097 domain-containing protein [Erysipelotrichales bacterium]|nr:DUF4097 domain-containing protein [Erysipelotrichales bacterium]